MLRGIVGFLLCLGMLPAGAAIQSKAVEYMHEDTKLTGYLYWDDAQRGKRPGVMVVHQWWGLDDYTKHRARMLAELGYVAFAADMYGTGKWTDQPAQAREWMQEVTADVEGWRARAELGLEQLARSGMMKTGQTATIGYCFGGATALQMAYGGLPVKGIVTFHAALPAAPEESGGKIDTRILVLHGQADSFVAPEVVSNFRNKLEEAGADWEMNTYGGVRHGFTDPSADSHGMDNLKYDARADARSWARMRSFFDELFSAP